MMIPGIVDTDTALYQYFAGYAFTHGDTQVRYGKGGRQLGGIFRLEQRIDGFISLDFDYEGGEVVTAPFTFTGRRLVLNVNTSAAGEGRVAILDAEGKEIPGFGLADARYINGNYTARTAAWQDGKSDVGGVGRPRRQAAFRLSRGQALFVPVYGVIHETQTARVSYGDDLLGVVLRDVFHDQQDVGVPRSGSIRVQGHLFAARLQTQHRAAFPGALVGLAGGLLLARVGLQREGHDDLLAGQRDPADGRSPPPRWRQIRSLCG